MRNRPAVAAWPLADRCMVFDADRQNCRTRRTGRNRVRDRWAGSACRAAAVAASKRGLLLIAAAAAIVVLAARYNWAQNQLNVGFHTFQDSRGVTVLSPDVGLDKDFTDRTGLRVKFGVDAISAASDSCARCHPEGATNSRVSLGVSMLRKYGDTKLTLGAEMAPKRFYSATTLQSAISRI